MNVKRFLMLTALVLLLAPAGCIFSPDNGTDPPPKGDPLPPALTREQAMTNFQTVYEKMDYTGYLTVIDPSFKIYLTTDTIQEFGLPQDYFDYDEESRIAQNMFSGNAITRPNGDIVPGIVGIDFVTFFAEDGWVQTQPDDRIPDAWRAPFRVDIIFHQGSRDVRVQGKIHFYLKEIEADGGTTYRMVGQVDETGQYPAKPTEGWSWGTVKALYR